MSYPPPGPQGMYPPPQAYAPPMMQPPTPPRAPAGPRGRRRYGIVRTLLLGLFSADVWRDVAQNWRGMGLLYMLVLLTLSWFVVLGKFHVSGLIAWLMWLFVHIFFLIGFRNRVLVMMQWAWAYFTHRLGIRLITGSTEMPE